MKIQVHIERLILDGVDVAADERAAVKAAVTAELTRQLQADGVNGDWENGRALARLTASPITLSPQQAASGVGQEIGRAVYGAISRGARR